MCCSTNTWKSFRIQSSRTGVRRPWVIKGTKLSYKKWRRAPEFIKATLSITKAHKYNCCKQNMTKSVIVSILTLVLVSDRCKCDGIDTLFLSSHALWKLSEPFCLDVCFIYTLKHSRCQQKWHIYIPGLQKTAENTQKAEKCLWLC